MLSISHQSTRTKEQSKGRELRTAGERGRNSFLENDSREPAQLDPRVRGEIKDGAKAGASPNLR